MNRVAQVNWMRELAGNLVANLGNGTAEEIIEFALSGDAVDWGIETPDWFDAHDRELLTDLVAKRL